jgi:rhomboid protease GluP
VEQRPICPNCRAFLSKADRVCPYCEFELSPKPKTALQPARVLGSLIPQGQTTVYILGVNFFLYLAMMLFNAQNGNGRSFLDLDFTTLFLFGAKEPTRIFSQGEWWRLVTAGFLHASVIHIMMNSWGLYDLGAQVEEVFGSGRYIVIYFASSVVGFLISSLWSPSLSVGASAGIFGLIGAMIAYGMQQSGTFGGYVKTVYTRSAVYALVISFLFPFTDNAAHIGGLAGGFAMAYVAASARSMQARMEKYWNMAALGCVAVVVLSFVVQLLQALRLLRQ